MSGGHFGDRLRPVEQRDGLLGTAIHRIHQLQVLHRVVIVGLRLDEEFLHGGRVGVAARLRQLHRRREVCEQVHGVLRRCRQAVAASGVELDVIEAVVLRLELRGQRAIGVHRERHALAVVRLRGRRPLRRDLAGARRRRRGERRRAQHHATTLRRHGRRDGDAHIGALQHGDVAAVLDLARLEARVRRIGKFEIELLHVRQLDHVQVEHGRAHARGFDHVLEGLGQVEQHALVSAVLALDHRHALKRRLRGLANQDGGVGGIKARDGGVDHLIRALRHLDAARLHLNAIRRCGFCVGGDDEDRRQGVTQVSGAEREQRDRR